MARDIRDLFKDPDSYREELKHEDMPKNHEARFLEKLDEAFPEDKRATKTHWWYMASSVVVLIGLGIGALNYFQAEKPAKVELAEVKTKTLGDVSPGLKKVEDYYLASINLELSKMKPTPETRAVFDGYLEQLETLNQEYERLSMELTENGPTELTVNALIDNLKFRLHLLYRLKEQLNTLDVSDDLVEETSQRT
ncbi:hypothetical protein H7U19_13500 [Hyunsoonleella sp. SJ7]|uniref:Anti-sigma factor n=1 Tax=Hyunsoonleella aquatilis TaxID=2762758 RepID=A0A923KIZ2_9FLAO|nr:hypothetical protein [Hyunsoonleella aquatilis]MBC3759429.1 hypothetical protein [Hyunsoonleella aquatilis]